MSLLVIFSCNNEEYMKNGLVGKYYNNFEENVTHYVQLNDDNTYLHYYKNPQENIERENKGEWKFIESDKKNEIMFSDWISFGIYEKEGCSGCLWSVKLKKGELFFSLDLREEMNFYKKD